MSIKDNDLPYPASAQDEQNEVLARTKPKLIPKAEMEALIASKGSYDPIESAMKNNPGLTREKAEEIAEAFGFM